MRLNYHAYIHTVSAEFTSQEKINWFPEELKLAPGGRAGTSNVISSSSGSSASKTKLNVCPNVTLITDKFWLNVGKPFSTYHLKIHNLLLWCTVNVIAALWWRQYNYTEGIVNLTFYTVYTLYIRIRICAHIQSCK